MKVTTILTLFFLLVFTNVQAQDKILLDGKFGEWSTHPIFYEDSKGDGGSSNIDFGKLQIANDEKYLYFSLEVGSVINLQDLNEITIYLDTDDNTETGTSVGGIGADLEYTLGNRSGVFYGSSNPIQIRHHNIGLVSAPTVTSDRFEIVINRNAKIGDQAIFEGDAIKVVIRDNFVNGDILPNPEDRLSYTYTSSGGSSSLNFTMPKHSQSDIRVVSYNVLFNGLFEEGRKDRFTRIFQAIQPDIVGFQEIYDFSSGDVAEQMEAMLPLAEGQEWFHSMEGPDCHLISRYPIIGSAFIPGYNSNAGIGAFLVDLPGEAGNMLIINAHPPCCANNEGRQIEIDLIMEFVREAKNGNGPLPLAQNEPIIILGDMNLVGDSQQLKSLLTGDIVDEASHGPDFKPDWDGSDFLDSESQVTGEPFSFTWYDEGSSFSPGKLDYIIYSGSTLKLVNKFALFTPGLPMDSLDTYGLMLDDAVLASDHLPLVTDFELGATSSVFAEKDYDSKLDLHVYPNPAQMKTAVSYELNQAGKVKLILRDHRGRIVQDILNDWKGAGSHSIEIGTQALPFGLYLVELHTSEGVGVSKLVVGEK